MLKNWLIEAVRDKQKGNFFFPAIKQAWEKESLLRTANYRWSKHINPSAPWFSFSGCPHKGLRDQSKAPQPNDYSKIEKMEIGNYLHDMFQDKSKQVPGLLWNDKGVELPIFWDKYELSGKIDLILNMYGEPVVGEIKIPQREEGFAWSSYKPKLPEETHLTQALVYAYALNEMKLLSKPVKKVLLLYFNPGVSKKGDGYVEVLEELTQEREEQLKLLLDHSKLELDNILAGRDNPCSYPGCKEHNS
jgi:hypothetical protein